MTKPEAHKMLAGVVDAVACDGPTRRKIEEALAMFKPVPPPPTNGAANDGSKVAAPVEARS